MKLIFKAIIKNTQKEITELDIARLNFNDGELYAIMTWNEQALFLEDIEILKLELK